VDLGNLVNGDSVNYFSIGGTEMESTSVTALNEQTTTLLTEISSAMNIKLEPFINNGNLNAEKLLHHISELGFLKKEECNIKKTYT
jgi:hypothetical protein